MSQTSKVDLGPVLQSNVCRFGRERLFLNSDYHLLCRSQYNRFPSSDIAFSTSPVSKPNRLRPKFDYRAVRATTIMITNIIRIVYTVIVLRSHKHESREHAIIGGFFGKFPRVRVRFAWFSVATDDTSACENRIIGRRLRQRRAGSVDTHNNIIIIFFNVVGRTACVWPCRTIRRCYYSFYLFFFFYYLLIVIFFFCHYYYYSYNIIIIIIFRSDVQSSCDTFANGT